VFGFFFFALPFLIALVGIAIGYFSKPVVLGVVTSLGFAVLLLATIALWGNSIDTYTYYTIIGVGICIIAPMWIAHKTKRMKVV